MGGVGRLGEVGRLVEWRLGEVGRLGGVGRRVEWGGWWSAEVR